MFEKGTAIGPMQPYFLTQVQGRLNENEPVENQPNEEEIIAQAEKTAELLAEYIGGAKHRLDIAIYDFRLPDGSAHDTVVNAINKAAQNGVSVRIAYDRDNEDKKPGTVDYFIGAASDPAPDGTNEFVASKRFHAKVSRKGITMKGINPQHHIMHQKYILRDARTAHASVLTGSTNFTVDAWALQENNILVLENEPDIVEMYENDYGEMWTSGEIGTTGVNDSGHFMLSGRTKDYDRKG